MAGQRQGGQDRGAHGREGQSRAGQCREEQGKAGHGFVQLWVAKAMAADTIAGGAPLTLW